MKSIEYYMQDAIKEAQISLFEGNHGFGAVIIKNDSIIAKAHDLEESRNDSTSHAEMNVIRLASKNLGKDLTGCILITTHEPCPMCATAIVWSGIKHLVYGYSINESIKRGRSRINITCDEIFTRSNTEIIIDQNVCFNQCSKLYSQTVRKEINRLRNSTDDKLKTYNDESSQKRLKWFNDNQQKFNFITDDALESAYRLLLHRFDIDQKEAPIIQRRDGKLVFHSMNFCPTLEACKILGLDTRNICKKYNEDSTDSLIKQIDNRLKFSRNYKKLRPYQDYCEEIIFLESNKPKGD